MTTIQGQPNLLRDPEARPFDKWCTYGKHWAAATGFYGETRRWNGRWCPECHRAFMRDYNSTPAGRHSKQKSEARPERQRSHKNRHLVAKFGITIAQYEKLLTDQNGQCGICQIPAADKTTQRSFHVDHCHVCHAIRGLLCLNCNVGNNWDKIPGWPTKAQEYLDRHQCSAAI